MDCLNAEWDRKIQGPTSHCSTLVAARAVLINFVACVSSFLIIGIAIRKRDGGRRIEALTIDKHCGRSSVQRVAPRVPASPQRLQDTVTDGMPIIWRLVLHYASMNALINKMNILLYGEHSSNSIVPVNWEHVMSPPIMPVNSCRG